MLRTGYFQDLQFLGGVTWRAPKEVLCPQSGRQARYDPGTRVQHVREGLEDCCYQNAQGDCWDALWTRCGLWIDREIPCLSSAPRKQAAS